MNKYLSRHLKLILILCVFGCKSDSVSYEDIESVSSLKKFDKLSFLSEETKVNVIDQIKILEIYSSIPVKQDILTYKFVSKNDTVIGLQAFLNAREIELNSMSEDLPFISIMVSENKRGQFNLLYEHRYKSKLLSNLILDNSHIVSIKYDSVREKFNFRRNSRNGNFINFGSFSTSSAQTNDTTALFNSKSIFKAFYVDSIKTMNSIEQ